MKGATVAVAACVLATAGAAPLRLTEAGVGDLRLGRPLAEIGSRWIGRTRLGCELASPRPLFAQLNAPLVGTATFSGAKPHRLVALSIAAGAVTDRGIALGAAAAAVRKTYPGVVAQDSVRPLEYHALTLRRNGKDRMWFMLDRKGGHVTEFALPVPQFCE